MAIQTIDRGTSGDTSDKFKPGVAFDTCQANDDFLNSELMTCQANVAQLTTTSTFTAQVNISAAGTTQGTATALTTTNNFTLFEVDTVASGAGIVLPTSTTSLRLMIVNRGANALKVYPASFGAIDGGASTSPITVGVNEFVLLCARDAANAWYSSQISATNINYGTLSDSRLPSTMTGKTFSSNVTIDSNYLTVGKNSSGLGGQIRLYSDDGVLRWGVGVLGTASEKNYSIYDNPNATARITVSYSTGNVLLGTATDAGYKLDVNGTCRFNGVAHDVQTVDGVGSIRLLYYVGSTVASGGTTSGGALYTMYFNTGGALSTGVAVSGTWKNITGRECDTTEACYFLRIV